MSDLAIAAAAAGDQVDIEMWSGGQGRGLPPASLHNAWFPWKPRTLGFLQLNAPLYHSTMRHSWVVLHAMTAVVSAPIFTLAAWLHNMTGGADAKQESPRDRDANPYELPSVDDLEVAALAAASAMQAMKELQQLSSDEDEEEEEEEVSWVYVLQGVRVQLCNQQILCVAVVNTRQRQAS